MKTWTPTIIAVVLAVIAILFPFFMAFVVKSPGWMQVGPFLERAIVPISAAVVAIGLIISLCLYFYRKN